MLSCIKVPAENLASINNQDTIHGGGLHSTAFASHSAAAGSNLCCPKNFSLDVVAI